MIPHELYVERDAIGGIRVEIAFEDGRFEETRSPWEHAPKVVLRCDWTGSDGEKCRKAVGVAWVEDEVVTIAPLSMHDIEGVTFHQSEGAFVIRCTRKSCPAGERRFEGPLLDALVDAAVEAAEAGRGSLRLPLAA